MERVTRRTGQDNARRLRDDILERARVPGAPSTLSGNAHSNESPATPGTVTRVLDDGTASNIFRYGRSVYGGNDYIGPHVRIRATPRSLIRTLK